MARLLCHEQRPSGTVRTGMSRESWSRTRRLIVRLSRSNIKLDGVNVRVVRQRQKLAGRSVEREHRTAFDIEDPAVQPQRFVREPDCDRRMRANVRKLR